jgi:hypothetical protein
MIYEEEAMTNIAKSAVVLAVAALVMAPQAVNGESLLRVRAGSGVDIQKYLAPLPNEVPWLTANSGAAAKITSPLPEAGSVSALLLTPKPVQTWTALSSQSAAAASSFVGMYN